MQLRYLQSISGAGEGIQKISHLAWTPDNTKLAVATADRVVSLYDESGEKRDKFKTKAADGNATGAYLICGLAFSPDSAKLAIAQSDSIVFVYRLGTGWDEKKSICNKFVQSSSVSCLAWASDRNGDVCFGLWDGKVKLGMLKNNKTYTLYAHPEGSPVVALAASPDGCRLVSAHADGSLYSFTFPDQQDGSGGEEGCIKVGHHSCAPCALAWGESILVVGGDRRVVFYNPATGQEQQVFDFSGDDEARHFASAAMNPAGDAAVVGAFDRLYVFAMAGMKGVWQPAGVKQISNMCSTTALAWKPDGSKLAVGGLRGNVDMWDTCIRRVRHKGKFELTYVSKRAVIVKTLATSSRIVLKSVYGYDVSKVSVFQDRFIVGRTHSTLLLGDLESCRLSEVPWEGGGGGERFYFENELVCLLYSSGEVHVIEYGINEVVLTLRTEHMSPYLLSVAIQNARGTMEAAKCVAYLMDATTLRVVDFAAASAAAAAGGMAGGMARVLATVSHNSRVDWLELNQRGSHLLFRDKRRSLYLFDITTEQRHPLLGFCQYVQWVPGSDCIVAQSRGDLCVWYGVNAPDRPTVIPVKGDVSGIERSPGRTDVLVDEGLTQAAYALDEGLIDFGAALEFLDFDRAISTLEALPPNPEVEAQWRSLAALALQHKDLAVAERCAAALGDVARVYFLHKLYKEAQSLREEQGDGLDQGAQPAAELPVAVEAQLAVLSQQWPVAEGLLLAQGQVDDAISAYKNAHRWEDAIRVADTNRHPSSDTIRAEHFKWLLTTDQEGRAGAVKEREGDIPAAILLYLKGGVPARAAQAIISHPGIAFDPALLSAVAAALAKAGLYEKAGDLVAHLGQPLDALASYKKAHAYRKAVELARGAAPTQVIVLEEEWGDWLMSQRQVDAAINHFIEAGMAVKAIEAALAARQFPTAAGIIEHLEPSKAAPFYKRIAQHYAANGALSEAEAFWLKAGLPMEAVEMYSKGGKWEAAQKVARGYLPESELQRFNVQRAREAEALKNWKEAECGYLAAGEVERAISMYKNNRMWDAMLRIVSQHLHEALAEAQLLVAQALQAEGQWREAERHYVAAKDWKAAIAMYRSQGAWEDALRVAKVYGGVAATKQLAYAWVVAVPPDEVGALLQRLGLGDAAVDAAIEAGAFGHAFQLAQVAAVQRIPDIHLKHAMFLEDNGRFAEAEKEFVSAGKPQEAIDMYSHARDWDAALRVAEQHNAQAVPEVLLAQAQSLAEAGQLAAAESVFLRARRPDAALAMYRSEGQWQAALRVAEAYLPAKAAEVHLEMANSMGQGAGLGASSLQATVGRAQALERGGDYARAVEAYLSPTGTEGPPGAVDLDAVQCSWEAALELAGRHQRHRVGDVAVAVASRLVGVGRIAAAVDVLEGVGDVRGAVEAALSGGLFDRARDLASGNPQLMQAVEEEHTRALVAGNDAEELAARGNTAAAVQMYAAQGNWQRAHELAAQAGLELSASTAAQHAALLLRQGDLAAAAAVLAKRGVSAADGSSLPLYRELALEILGASQASRDPQAEQDIRDVMHRLLQQLELSATTRKQDIEDFSRLFWAAHYVSSASRSQGAGLSELVARQLTAALRYTGILPADRAFYEAGVAWKLAGRASMAFVLLNRFLDVADAVDEAEGGGGGSGMLEGSDLVNTDIPRDVALPSQHYTGDGPHEEARNYVLELSMDQRVEQQLGTRQCESCYADTYEANLECHACGHRWDACVVSGYPVPPSERVVSKANLPARRDDWNAWVGAFGTDPVTGLPATPLY